MIPIDNQAAVDQDKTAVQLALYDLESKKLTYWFESDNDDTSVQTMMYEYTEEGSEVKEVYRENEKIVIFSVSKEGNLALIRNAPMLFGKRELYPYNLNTGNKEKLNLPNVSYVEHAFFLLKCYI